MCPGTMMITVRSLEERTDELRKAFALLTNRTKASQIARTAVVYAQLG